MWLCPSSCWSPSPASVVRPAVPPDEEPAGLHVPRRPGKVADALEPEHRVEDVERDHVDPVVGIGGGGGDPRARRAGLGDALLEDLPVAGLAVEHELVGVLRHVELALVGVDPELAEQPLHAEGARLVRHDGHHEAADLPVADQRGEDAHERHRGGNFALAAALEQRIERGELRYFQGRGLAAALRQVAAEPLPALAHVPDLGAVVGGTVERGVRDLVVRDRDVEPVAERLERVLAHLLLLVGDVLSFARFPHPVALHGLGEDHGRLPGVPGGLGVGRVDLVRVVAAAVQPPDVLVGQVRHHLPELRVLAEEVLPGVGPALGLEVLVLAVDRLLHALAQQPLGVEVQQRVPVRAPDHLQHVPAGPAEGGFELLDDLAVAAHRAVEALEVAVDDEDEVVELLARGQRDRAERLGSSISPSPMNAQTLRCEPSIRPRWSR